MGTANQRPPNPGWMEYFLSACWTGIAGAAMGAAAGGGFGLLCGFLYSAIYLRLDLVFPIVTHLATAGTFAGLLVGITFRLLTGPESELASKKAPSPFREDAPLVQRRRGTTEAHSDSPAYRNGFAKTKAGPLGHSSGRWNVATDRFGPA
jgi:hypothetical protein